MYISISAFVVLNIILKRNWSHAQIVDPFEKLYLDRLQNCEDCYNVEFIGICKNLYRECKNAQSEKNDTHKKAFEESAKRNLRVLNNASNLEPELNSSAYCLGFLEDGIAGKQFCNIDLGSEKDITYSFLAKKLGDSLQKEFDASSVETVRIIMQPENVTDEEAFMDSLLSELPDNESADLADGSGEESTKDERGSESPGPTQRNISETIGLHGDSLSWSSLERGSAQNFVTYKVWFLHRPKKSRKKAEKVAIKKSTQMVLRDYGKGRVNFTSEIVDYKKGYFVVEIKVDRCRFC